MVKYAFVHDNIPYTLSTKDHYVEYVRRGKEESVKDPQSILEIITPVSVTDGDYTFFAGIFLKKQPGKLTVVDKPNQYIMFESPHRSEGAKNMIFVNNLKVYRTTLFNTKNEDCYTLTFKHLTKMGEALKYIEDLSTTRPPKYQEVRNDRLALYIDPKTDELMCEDDQLNFEEIKIRLGIVPKPVVKVAPKTPTISTFSVNPTKPNVPPPKIVPAFASKAVSRPPMMDDTKATNLIQVMRSYMRDLGELEDVYSRQKREVHKKYEKIIANLEAQ